MKLHHLAIQVVDLDVSLRFWRDVLGLRETRRQAHSVWLDLQGALLMLERCDGDGSDAPPWKHARAGLHLVAIAIAPGERAHWRAKLEAAGFPVEHETNFTLYVRDPDGTRVGLSHYPDA